MAEENTNVELTQEQKDAQSAEKFRAQNSVSNTAVKSDDAGEKPQRPDHVPEKFWDAEKGEVRTEELLKSYSELEKARGEKPADKPAETPPAGEGEPNPIVAEVLATREAMTAQIASGQPITEDQYKVLEKVGFSKDDVDAFIVGQTAVGELAKLQVEMEAGGEANYKSMIEWARSAYTPEEVAAYDNDVHSGDKAVRLNAVRGLKARFEAANGREGKRDVTKDGGSPGTADFFKSKAEMVSAMRDPRYAKDAAFREDVARKVHAAARAGVNLSS